MTNDPIEVSATPMRPAQHPGLLVDMFYSHCRDSGIIATGVKLCSKDSPAEAHPRYSRPMRVDLRQQLMPFLLQELTTVTKYLVLCTLYERCLLGKSIDQFYENDSQTDPTKLEYFAVKKKHIRELGMITLDLDVGRPGWPTAKEAWGEVADLANKNIIPKPTLLVYSGRGLYLLWRLIDEQGLAPLNTRENFQVYRQCAVEIMARLAHLNPDKWQPHTWFKAPGTLADEQTGALVEYDPYVGIDPETGWYRSYTFGQLTQALAVSCSEPRAELPEPDGTEKARPVRRKVNYAVRGVPPWSRNAHFNLTDEVEVISRARGGIKEGCRELTLFYYYKHLRAGLTGTKRFRERARHGRRLPKPVKQRAKRVAWRLARIRTERLNQGFSPPLPASEVEKIFRYADGGRFFAFKEKPRDPQRGFASGARIAATLKVTGAEIIRLDLKHVLPDGFKESQDQQAKTEDQVRRGVKKIKQAMVDMLIRSGLKPRQVIAELAPEIEVKSWYISRRRKALKLRKQDLERTAKLFR